MKAQRLSCSALMEPCMFSRKSNLISLTDFESSDDGFRSHRQANFVKDLGIGRPLGGKFSPDGRLFILLTPSWA
jgi:hypothetical protein